MARQLNQGSQDSISLITAKSKGKDFAWLLPPPSQEITVFKFLGGHSINHCVGDVAFLSQTLQIITTVLLTAIK